jgi:hypothetical protein
MAPEALAALKRRSSDEPSAEEKVSSMRGDGAGQLLLHRIQLLDGALEP